MRVGLLLACLVAYSSFAGQASQALARSYVHKAIDAVGGIDLLKGIKTLRIDYRGHYYILDESEWADGPWSVSYDHTLEVRDYPHDALRQDSERSFFISPEVERTSLTVIENAAQTTRNGKPFAASIYSGEPDNAKESLAFVPERLLPEALEASDLDVRADVTLHGVRYHVVSLAYKGLPTRMYFSADSGLLGVIDWTNSYPNSIFWQVWGDVTNRAEFSVYSLLPGGLRVPLQRDYERNGQPYHSESIFNIEVNPSVPPGTFALDPKVAEELTRRKESGSLMPRLGQATPIVEGDDSLVQYIGEFNCAMVEQDDGVVIIEAPVDSAFSKEILAEAERRFPHTPIKAVISTSGAWAHAGGLAQMVARGIPIYATDVNRPLLTRLVRAGSTGIGKRADGSEPKFHWISGRTSFGSGSNRMEIHPVRNASGEGSLMVYFPAHKLLYSSDLIQPLTKDTFFWPEYLREMTDAVKRENLVIGQFFGMHAGVTSWDAVVQFLDKVQQRAQR